VDVLPVGRDDDEHHDRDEDRDLPGEGIRREPGERQRDQDLVGGVGHRGECVGGEDRQRDALGEQRLAQLRARELAADQHALAQLRDAHHEQRL
jgi:hypothetical protein